MSAFFGILIFLGTFENSLLTKLTSAYRDSLIARPILYKNVLFRTFKVPLQLEHFFVSTVCNSEKKALHTTQNSFYKRTKLLTLEMTIFGLKVMVKSHLEFFILKLNEPLQRYMQTCKANSAFLGSFFCTGQQQL